MNLFSFWRHEDWRPAFVLREKRLLDGTSATGHLMQRWLDGKWEYRQMTQEELLAEMCSSSW